LSVKIVSEAKRRPEVIKPPANARPHLWFRDMDAELLRLRMGEDMPLPVYVSKHAEAKMRNHALSARDSKTEVMGLLLGEVRRWRDVDYILVRDAATTDLDATSVSVKFDSAGFEKLFENLDMAGFDYVVVGWYHSHPGYGCFLSETDVKTHSGIFVGRHNAAFVIDPEHFEIAGFRLRDGKAEKIDFAVYWDQYDDPYGGLVRVRANPQIPHGNIDF
jgi:26S proteasome regulatory subunit N11